MKFFLYCITTTLAFPIHRTIHRRDNGFINDVPPAQDFMGDTFVGNEPTVPLARSKPVWRNGRSPMIQQVPELRTFENTPIEHNLHAIEPQSAIIHDTRIPSQSASPFAEESFVGGEPVGPPLRRTGRIVSRRPASTAEFLPESSSSVEGNMGLRAGTTTAVAEATVESGVGEAAVLGGLETVAMEAAPAALLLL